jgi:rhamnosyltransferase subunit B
MAHVLIGWEFGANRGHAARMGQVAAALRQSGHSVSFALQRLDALREEEAAGDPVWQAPLSPRLLVSGAVSRRGPPAGMADILARLGFDDPVIVAALVVGWRRLLETVAPDAVVADFAPSLLLAARGRVPTITVGGGFELPPAGMAQFPLLIEGMDGVDQRGLLAAVNAGLAAAGGELLPAVPAIFAADRANAATFTELDPYAAHRADPLALPLEPGFDAAAGEGEEVFVYAPERIGPEAPLWQGLAAAGLPVRIHVPRASAELAGALTRLGVAFEAEPVPFAAIAERSRLLVSHGGHGFVCAGLAAGLPHVVCHYDLEKLVTGTALARHGFGGHVALASIRPEPFGASLARLHRDEALAARARAAAPGFRRRAQVPLGPAVAEAVAALL